MEAKTIFREKDKVYVASVGWGTVIDAGCSTPSGWVSIESNGKIFCVETYFVSFTKYTLEGFSQERPEELPDVGQIVWVRDSEYDNWMITYFRRYAIDRELKYGTNPRNSGWSHDTYFYRYLTTENPYK